jgi:DNA-binding CsgD family transcriptional regulator
MPVPILVVNDEGRITDANDAAEALFGPSVGRFCDSVVCGREQAGRPVCQPGCARRLQEGDTAQKDTHRLRIRGGTHRLVCSSVGTSVVVTVLKEDQLIAVRDALTPREREVLTEVAAGLNNREIAEKLGVSYSTARTHVERAREKLGVATQAAAVAHALASGQIDLEAVAEPPARNGTRPR